MGDSFPNHFTTDHEVLFYESPSNLSYQIRSGKDKSSLMMKSQEILKENINSPEFSLFHMASPDLERLIVGSNSTTANTRETTTINTSDLNVLNLMSPDFEKIFSNFQQKDSGQDSSKERSVEKQHEIYTKTFVEALNKIQTQPHLERKDGLHNVIRGTTVQQQNNNLDNEKNQFVKRNEQQMISEHHRRIRNKSVNQSLSNYSRLPSKEDKNKNRLGTQHSYGSKAGNIVAREDLNTMTTHFALNTSNNTVVEPHMEVTNTGFVSGANPNLSNLVRQCNLDPSTLNMGDRNRNTIQANYSNLNPTNPRLRICNPNQSDHGNQTHPNPSEVNLESHPELYKLHAHVKISENMIEQVPSGHQNVHTSPQVFPLPPIDLQVQEIVKRERKKQKNRVAASKCRKKKLEREAQLEVRVQELRERNIELTALASALKNQLTNLKQHVMEHIACGCHVTAY